ncbi:UNVERIFIED_ORG: hypothetical protein M2312_000613 [Rhizobium esperanzae]|nr:hypothetical protein [Rhizobium esperanzae]
MRLTGGTNIHSEKLRGGTADFLSGGLSWQIVRNSLLSTWMRFCIQVDHQAPRLGVGGARPSWDISISGQRRVTGERRNRHSPVDYEARTPLFLAVQVAI